LKYAVPSGLFSGNQKKHKNTPKRGYFSTFLDGRKIIFTPFLKIKPLKPAPIAKM
jgi:hypothetical protein